MAEIDSILQHADAMDATALHIRSDLRPRLRVGGELQEIEGTPPLSGSDIHRLTTEVMTEEQRDYLATHDELDFTYSNADGRYRCACFRDHRGPGAVFRRVPKRIARLQHLGLSKGIEQFAHLRRGLMLVTGAPGSGKSATLASILDVINERYHKHIITLEDPIEHLYEDRLGVFHQRRLHDDFDCFESGIREAMRQDPDVLVIGDLRGSESMRLALTAAESGILVFATLDTKGAAETLDRIIDTFPDEDQPRVRVQLAECLAGIVSQTLLHCAEGTGRVPATEVLVATPAVAALIRDDKTRDIPNIIQGGRSHGMHTLDDSLLDLLGREEVTSKEAWSHARNKGRFEDSPYSEAK